MKAIWQGCAIIPVTLLGRDVTCPGPSFFIKKFSPNTIGPTLNKKLGVFLIFLSLAYRA
jgi:hypothetical protein